MKGLDVWCPTCGAAPHKSCRTLPKAGVPSIRCLSHLARLRRSQGTRVSEVTNPTHRHRTYPDRLDRQVTLLERTPDRVTYLNHRWLPTGPVECTNSPVVFDAIYEPLDETLTSSVLTSGGDGGTVTL